jgi:hypothetical protein
MSTSTWPQLRDRLAAALSTLQEGEFVILSSTEPLGYTVQFIGQGQSCLLATCEGPTLVGGALELTEEQDRRIRDLGWRWTPWISRARDPACPGSSSAPTDPRR